MSVEKRCRLCGGAACEEGCGRCDQSPSVAGPNAHRWCSRCSGSGVDPIDAELNTEFMRDRVGFHAANPEAARLKADVLKACDEIDRLRAEIVMLVEVGATVLDSLSDARAERDAALARVR